MPCVLMSGFDVRQVQKMYKVGRYKLMGWCVRGGALSGGEGAVFFVLRSRRRLTHVSTEQPDNFITMIM